MRDRAEQLLIVTVAGLLLLGVVAITFPQTIPLDVSDIFGDVVGSLDSATTALLVGIGVLALGVTVRKFTSTPTVNRTPIVQEPVETIRSNGYVTIIHPLEQSYDSIIQNLTSPERAERRLSMYGRKAIPHIETDHQIEEVINELATTAIEVYSVKENISVEEAEQHIDNGTWTTNATAAAFLSKTDDGPEFSTLQRLIGYVSPKYTLEKRVNATTEAIDQLASSFLTHNQQFGDDETEPVEKNNL